MGLGDWLKDRAEIKDAEKEAYDEEKVKAHAERQRIAIEEAKVAGKVKAHTGFQMPKPNPKKIAAIKSVLGAMGDKAAKAGERINNGEMEDSDSNKQSPDKYHVSAKKVLTPEEKMAEYNKTMKETLGY